MHTVHVHVHMCTCAHVHCTCMCTTSCRSRCWPCRATSLAPTWAAAAPSGSGKPSAIRTPRRSTPTLPHRQARPQLHLHLHLRLRLHLHPSSPPPPHPHHHLRPHLRLTLTTSPYPSPTLAREPPSPSASPSRRYAASYMINPLLLQQAQQRYFRNTKNQKVPPRPDAANCMRYHPRDASKPDHQ